MAKNTYNDVVRLRVAKELKQGLYRLAKQEGTKPAEFIRNGLRALVAEGIEANRRRLLARAS